VFSEASGHLTLEQEEPGGQVDGGTVAPGVDQLTQAAFILGSML
jgi:hypothetical protein